jgi:hypothetical protein
VRQHGESAPVLWLHLKRRRRRPYSPGRPDCSPPAGFDNW